MTERRVTLIVDDEKVQQINNTDYDRCSWDIMNHLLRQGVDTARLAENGIRIEEEAP